MSVKAVRKYYDQICEQYHEMVQNIKDLEVECQQGIVDPERIERLKEQIAPFKQNYERWTYMMFLLNQPQKKSKHKRYGAMNGKMLRNLDPNNNIEATLQENKEVISKVGK